MLARSILVLALVALATAQTCSQVQNTIIGLNFIAQMPATSPGDCCDKCNANAGCVAYTFDSNSNDCFLKDNLGGNSTQSNRVSGTNGRTPADTWDACTGRFASLPFCDTSKTVDERLDDLVSRVPLDSVGGQLTARQSDELSNIGLPSYYWGTNAIHGLQNTDCLPDGQCPTSFPAPNGLAASFNFSYVEQMGRIIGREMRAYYNDKHHNSLDSWSPTHNPSRDPRWGRNVESPGEDPLVCGMYSSAYTRGIQYGPDNTVRQATVTLKHWVAYSLESYNGHTRHNFDANVSAYDLQDTYFPAWQRTIQEAGAKGVMCSYNMLNGKPTCGNPALTDILRKDWGFTGYITSDSDSVADFWQSHHYVQNAVQATALGVKSGCDIDSGSTYRDNLAAAVNQSLITRDQANQCLKNSYKMRFEMGLFDPKIPNYYRNISTAEVGQPSYQQVSLESARATMTLLKNDDNTLPFPTGKKLAVLGVSSNSSGDLLGNYVGPICPSGKFDCVPTIFQKLTALNNGPTSLVDDPKKVDDAVAAAKDADHVVLVISNAGDGGGEGHDRMTINLPSDQQAFADAVIKVGKPTVVITINGGLISIDNIKESAKAVLVAFMPGVHGAQAVAETVFGSNNPAGRLPVTMYPANFVNENNFLNMSMQAAPGRSYKYYTGTPLYPFGYGISYTTFKLEWSPSPPARVSFNSTDAAKEYTCTVTNTGKVDGDEVVLGFFKPDKASLRSLPEGNPVPQKQLFDFKRVHVPAGQSVKVTLTLNATTLALVDTDGHRSLHAGAYGVQLWDGSTQELTADVAVDVPEPIRLSTFRKWW